MPTHYQHLGPYSDLVAAAKRSHRLLPIAKPGRATQKKILETLAFNPGPGSAKPRHVKVDQTWTRDGVEGQAISWSVGYGPRTAAWLLRPAGVRGRLPGVLALHDHGGYKFYGKEKIADGPTDLPALAQTRREFYAGRPWANDLARQGYCVLVPDVFLWGSRRFPFTTLHPAARDTPETERDIDAYNRAAILHEHTVQKYCHALGTTATGILSYEDRLAAEYLANRAGVRRGGVACLGLSGGGLRATLLQATCPHIRAAVVAGMMTTYDSVLDHNIVNHTWLVYPPGWARHGDWPDLASARAPSPLMCLYNEDDDLFTLAGQRAAHRRLARQYKSVGAARNYVGKFYPGPHKFDAPMQADAFAWIKRVFG